MTIVPDTDDGWWTVLEAIAEALLGDVRVVVWLFARAPVAEATDRWLVELLRDHPDPLVRGRCGSPTWLTVYGTDSPIEEPDALGRTWATGPLGKPRHLSRGLRRDDAGVEIEWEPVALSGDPEQWLLVTDSPSCGVTVERLGEAKADRVVGIGGG